MIVVSTGREELSHTNTHDEGADLAAIYKYNRKGKSELQAKSAVPVKIVLEVRDNEHSLMCPTDCGNDSTVDNDETERVDRERGTENSNHDGSGPLNNDQWTLVQNPRRAWKEGNGVIKDD
jgi:hypothetical protein